MLTLRFPFGTSIDAETSDTTATATGSGAANSGSSGAVAPSNQRFTSYDRSGVTGLDYAVNRTYNPGQSRFTSVDPIGMASASIGNPQSLNMFAYVTNDPVGKTDTFGTNEDSCGAEYGYTECGGDGGFWFMMFGNRSGSHWRGGPSFGGNVAYDRQTLGDLPKSLQASVDQYLYMVSNDIGGNGFNLNGYSDRSGVTVTAVLFGFGLTWFAGSVFYAWQEVAGIDMVQTPSQIREEARYWRIHRDEISRKILNDENCNSSFLDICLSFFAGFGGQVGIQINAARINIYGGYGAGTPGAGISVSASKGKMNTSPWVSAQAGAVGGIGASTEGIDAKGKLRNMSVTGIVTTPGASITTNSSLVNFDHGLNGAVCK